MRGSREDEEDDQEGIGRLAVSTEEQKGKPIEERKQGRAVNVCCRWRARGRGSWSWMIETEGEDTKWEPKRMGD